MSRTKAPDKVESQPKVSGFPRSKESKLEDLPSEWVQEDCELENRKPDLGEDDKDPSER